MTTDDHLKLGVRDDFSLGVNFLYLYLEISIIHLRNYDAHN